MPVDVSLTQTRLAGPQRIVSIDLLRGITIAFMILVNDPGDWSHVFAPLQHAVWNGCTPTDLVFPTFIFLVGCSTVFAIDSRHRRGDSTASIAGQITRRAIILFLIKIAISLFPYFHYSRMRLFGVLPRIALCYFAAAMLYLFLRKLKRVRIEYTVLILFTLILVGYWALLRFVTIPGIGVPMRDVPFLDQNNNLAAWMDRGFSAFTLRYLHTGTLYETVRDPEGLLSTLPSIATALAGVWASLVLRSQRTQRQITTLLLGAAIFDIVAGLLWSHWFPLNKNLWTSSYVLFSAGVAEGLLGVSYFFFDAKRIQHDSPFTRALLWPWLVFGSNAIFGFVLSNLLVKISSWIRVPNGDKHTSVFGWLYLHVFARGNSTEWTSLAYAVFFVLLCFLPTWFLWRRQIFLRV